MSAEFNRLVFEAVNENSVSKLKLAKSTCDYKGKLESVVQCNVKGETPLLIAMRMENEILIRELVPMLKYCDHTLEENRLDFFIAIDQLSQQIPIVKLIDYLISDFDDSIQSAKWLEFIAHAVIQSTSFTRQNKIIALELIGASLVINSLNAPLVNSFLNCRKPMATLAIFGLDCWRKAMTLRYFPQNGEPSLPKTSAVCVPSEASSVVFGAAIEVMSVEALDLLQARFERINYAPDRDMQVQALLFIRRICSEANLERPYGLYLLCLMTFQFYVNLQMGFNSEDNKLISNICLLVFEQLNGFDPQLISHKSFDAISKALSFMSMYFVDMFKPHGTPGREATYANLLACTKFIETVSKFFPNPTDMCFTKWGYCNDFAEMVYGFLRVLNSISPQLSNQEKQELEECYSHYMRDFFPERTSTVLHVAVAPLIESFIDNNPYYGNFDLDSIKLILRLGGDPNAIDSLGRTPLFLLTIMEINRFCSRDFFIRRPFEKDYLRLYQVLVEAGSHLDVVTDIGDSVLVLLNLMKHENVCLTTRRYFESLLYDYSHTVFPLTRYCARIIRRNGIPFDDLPPRLRKFVSLPLDDVANVPNGRVRYQNLNAFLRTHFPS